MASKGKTDKVGETETGDDKDFKDTGVEGKKKKTDDAEKPVTCETVISDLRKKKYPI